MLCVADNNCLYSRAHHFMISDLPYDSVASFAATSRATLYDVLPCVSVLHIEKSSQLCIGLVSNQFRDVRNISIYNLFHQIDDDDDISDAEFDEDQR